MKFKSLVLLVVITLFVFACDKTSKKEEAKEIEALEVPEEAPAVESPVVDTLAVEAETQVGSTR